MTEDKDPRAGFLGVSDSDQEKPAKQPRTTIGRSLLGRYGTIGVAAGSVGFLGSRSVNPPTREVLQYLNRGIGSLLVDQPREAQSSIPSLRDLQNRNEKEYKAELEESVAAWLQRSKTPTENKPDVVIDKYNPSLTQNLVAPRKQRARELIEEFTSLRDSLLPRVNELEESLEQAKDLGVKISTHAAGLMFFAQRAFEEWQEQDDRVVSEYELEFGSPPESHEEEWENGLEEWREADEDGLQHAFDEYFDLDRHWEESRVIRAQNHFLIAMMEYELARKQADIFHLNAMILAAETDIGDDEKSLVIIPQKVVARLNMIRQCVTRAAGFELIREVTDWTYNRMAVNAQVAQSAITRFMGQDLLNNELNLHRERTLAFDLADADKAEAAKVSSIINFKDTTLDRIADHMIDSMRAALNSHARQYIDSVGWYAFVSKPIIGADNYMDARPIRMEFEEEDDITAPSDHTNYQLCKLHLSAVALALVAPQSNLGSHVGPELAGWFDIASNSIHPGAVEETAADDTIHANNVEPVTFTETGGLFPVIGYVQAGEWRAAVEELPEFVSYPGVGADEAEFGLRVRGDSMDKRFPEGSILYCNRYNEEDDKLPIGEYVIVMRQDKASDEVEATCKRLEKHESLPDAYVLQPESSNRNHTRMLLENTDDEKVWIHAVVVGAFIKF